MSRWLQMSIAVLCCAFASLALSDSAPLSNKWRIQCSGGAESSGVIRFRVTPKGGAPVEVMVSVADGRSENGVARDIRDAFRQALPRGYSAETDDGEDVLLKKGFTRPRFSLELISSTVEDVRINLDRE